MPPWLPQAAQPGVGMADVITGNFAQVEAALGRTALKVNAADEVVEEEAANLVAEIASRLAPRLTGNLRASIDDDGAYVIADTDYAGYMEYGTRHNAAQPFMRPAKELAEIPVRQGAERIYTVASR